MKKSNHMLLAVASMAFALNAYANPVVSHTTSPDQSVTVFDLESFDDGFTTLDLNKFNGGPGATLQSVKVELFSKFTGTINVENLSTTSPLAYTQWVGSSVALTLTPSSILTADSSTSKAINLGQFDGTNDFDGSSGTSVGFSADGYKSFVYSDAGTLSAFSGPGTLTATVSGVSNSWGTLPNGNQYNEIPTQIDAYAVVTYTYVTAVPEPETYAMLLGGLALMGVVARRRKSA